MRLPDPARTWGVLVGTTQASSDGTLPPLPAVGNNVHALLGWFTGPTGTAVPTAHAESLVDVDDPHIIEESLLDLADRAADAIVFYFAGHGLIDEVGDLYLATTRSSRSRPQLRSLPWSSVRRTLRSARADNKIVILDCCYSGRALAAMGAGADGTVAVRGAYTITSTGGNQTAHAPVGDEYTAFTGALLETLTEGEPSGPQLLGLDTVYASVARRLSAADRPRPRQEGTDTVSELALGRNAAWKPLLTTEAPVAPARLVEEQPAPVPTVAGPRVTLGSVTVLPVDGQVLGLCFPLQHRLAAVVSRKAPREEAVRSRSRRVADWAASGGGMSRLHVSSWPTDDLRRVDRAPLPLPHVPSFYIGTAAAASSAEMFVLTHHDCLTVDLEADNGAPVLDLRSLTNPRNFGLPNVRSALSADGSLPLLVRHLGGLGPRLVSDDAATVSVVSVVEARSGRVRSRVAVPPWVDGEREQLLGFHALPGGRSVLFSRVGGDGEQLRRIVFDLVSGCVVQDSLLRVESFRRADWLRAGNHDLRLSTDGQHLAVVRDRRVRLYSVDGDGIAINVPGDHVEWSPTAPIAAVCDANSLRLIDPSLKNRDVVIDLPLPAVGRPAFHPTGRAIGIPAKGAALLVDVHGG